MTSNLQLPKQPALPYDVEILANPSQDQLRALALEHTPYCSRTAHGSINKVARNKARVAEYTYIIDRRNEPKAYSSGTISPDKAQALIDGQAKYIADKGKLLVHAQRLNERIPFRETFFISASTGDGLPEMKAALAAAMPEGPWHFPADQVSNATDRMLSAEITREQLYHQLHAELPYETAVETEKYSERDDGSVEIHQQIFVARSSQKAIVLGKGGQRLKEIGSKARAELSELLGCPVHLYLHVKVKDGWDDDRGVYRDIGLDWVD